MTFSLSKMHTNSTFLPVKQCRFSKYIIKMLRIHEKPNFVFDRYFYKPDKYKKQILFLIYVETRFLIMLYSCWDYSKDSQKLGKRSAAEEQDEEFLVCPANGSHLNLRIS